MSGKCETCGSEVSSYPMGCPGCGAPNCCQRCCDEGAKAMLEIRVDPKFKPLLDALKPIPCSHFWVRTADSSIDITQCRKCGSL